MILFYVQNCCPRNCHLKFNEEDQKRLFQYYWSLAQYTKQILYLFGLISNKERLKTVLNQIENGTLNEPKFSRWNYHIDIDGVRIDVYT